MMTCDTVVRLVSEMYGIANKISKAEEALDSYEKRGLVHVRPSRWSIGKTSCCNENIS